jgi:hypothetical protein
VRFNVRMLLLLTTWVAIGCGLRLWQLDTFKRTLGIGEGLTWIFFASLWLTVPYTAWLTSRIIRKVESSGE